MTKRNEQTCLNKEHQENRRRKEKQEKPQATSVPPHSTLS